MIEELLEFLKKIFGNSSECNDDMPEDENEDECECGYEPIPEARCVCEAHIVCSNCSIEGEYVHMAAGDENVRINDISELTKKNVILEKSFSKCSETEDERCVVIEQDAIEGKEWQDTDTERLLNGWETLKSESSYMICTAGGGVLHFLDPNPEINSIIEGRGYVKSNLTKCGLIRKTITDAYLIMDTEKNPLGLPLYTYKTMNGDAQYLDLSGYKEAKYDYVALSTNKASIANGNYWYIHPQASWDDDRIPENYNPDYHGSFASGEDENKKNSFSIADNRIEIAVRRGIASELDHEAFTYELAGKYIDVVLSDGTVLACIMGDAKGDEKGSSPDGILHHDGSIIEFLGLDNDSFSEGENMNCEKEDILHGCDIAGVYVYSEKRLYDSDTGEYTYFFSDNKGDMK